jgi:hypothetical protein
MEAACRNSSREQSIGISDVERPGIRLAGTAAGRDTDGPKAALAKRQRAHARDSAQRKQDSPNRARSSGNSSRTVDW